MGLAAAHRDGAGAEPEEAMTARAKPVLKYRMRPDRQGVRRRVVELDGVEGFEVTDSIACTGCNETPEFTHAADRGMGCHECGYTGRRQMRHWVPFDLGAWDRPQRESTTERGT